LETQEFIDSKFRLVILAAKRARQLLRGGRKKVDMVAENPLTIALEEIRRGLINYEITDGTPRKPDLSIFGDSEEAVDGEEGSEVDVTDLDGDGEPDDGSGRESSDSDTDTVGTDANPDKATEDEPHPDEADPETDEKETQPAVE